MKVGLTLSLFDIQTLPGGEELAEKAWNDDFAHYLPYLQKDDFIGVQNYTRKFIEPDGSQSAPEGSEVTQMRYEFYPEGVGHVIRRVLAGMKECIADRWMNQIGVKAAST